MESTRSDIDLVTLLDRFADAWNRHDLDALMSMMTDDCVFEASAGPEVTGQRSEGGRRFAPHTPPSSKHFMTRIGRTPGISSPVIVACLNGHSPARTQMARAWR